MVSGQPLKKRERATKRVLSFRDNDVAAVRRTPEGKVVVVRLDCDGKPISSTAEAWPDELHGAGWHPGAIRRVVERLPLQGAPLNPAPDGEMMATRMPFVGRSQTATPARRSSARNSITSW